MGAVRRSGSGRAAMPRHCPAVLQLLPWLRPGAWPQVKGSDSSGKEGDGHLVWVSGVLVGGGREGLHVEVM